MIPYSWVSFCPQNPARGRWDQEHLRRLLDGEEWVVPGVEYVETPWVPGEKVGKILIVPTGHYVEHQGCTRRMLAQFRQALKNMPWALVILTSDELASFPIDQLLDLRRVSFWVQLPDPERVYPPDTRFFGEGSPFSGRQIAELHDPIHKTTDVFFAGQNRHERRNVLVEEMGRLENSVCLPTLGFAQGLPPESYHALMAAAKVVPAPSGRQSQSSFRLYEALEAQAVPLADTVTQHGKANGYWDLVHPGSPLHKIGSWRALKDHVEVVLEPNRPGGWERNVSVVSSWWQVEKRRQAWQLTDDVYRLTNDLSPFRHEEQITVLVSSSPSPTHPDPWVLNETLMSIRSRLPNAEILVSFDGVRHEQRKRFADYYEYVRRCCARFNIDRDGILPIVHREHLHQAEMTRRALELVRTPFILFVEHDTPLVGEIPFDDLRYTMDLNQLNVMRLHHEHAVLNEHAHLYLEDTPPIHEAPNTAPYVRTMQWSQRPHLAWTDWYRDLLRLYFAPTARTMIEDVVYGIVETDWFENDVEAWNRWRIGLYAPEGSWVRSTHLDGRGDDPKYPMTFMYPGATPEGAPQPGTR